MNALARRVRRLLFGIAPDETTFARRGFRGGSGGVRERLEQIPRVFAQGYHAALETNDPGALAARLNALDAEHRGFAFEGAAMGWALFDGLTPWRRDRVRSLLRHPAGADHIYMVHVGVGWAMARLRARPARTLARLDPVLGWLALDGLGFHEGFFHWPRCLRAQARPPGLVGYERRAFDQGLGRSLWFVEGAEVDGIGRTIEAFPLERRGDLWAGIGLAATYAGGVDETRLVNLRERAGAARAPLAQGAAFAAKARLRAGIVVPDTRLAARVLCGCSVEEAASVTDIALANLPDGGDEPAYELWRQRIQQALA